MLCWMIQRTSYWNTYFGSDSSNSIITNNSPDTSSDENDVVGEISRSRCILGGYIRTMNMPTGSKTRLMTHDDFLIGKTNLFRSDSDSDGENDEVNNIHGKERSIMVTMDVPEILPMGFFLWWMLCGMLCWLIQ